MKLTLELDPIADRALFDRVMAAVMDHPAPVTMESTAPVEMQPTPEPEVAPEEMSTGPRVYGEAGEGRKRRTKEEMAEDKRIDELASLTNLAIRTDVPATELLADMEAAHAEDQAPEPKQEEESFDLEADEPEEEITMDAFRAAVLKANKVHGAAAVNILKGYGSGIKQIPAEKYREVLKRLADLDA